MGNKLVAGAGKRGRRRKVQWAGLVFVSPLLAGLLFVFGVWFWEVFRVMDTYLWDVDDADA